MADLHLGFTVDPATHVRGDDRVTVPSDELTTHGVIVGMTGSGKTGLGVALIEETLRSGVPALLIDPKGDLTNLALTFPNLSPVEFQPWIDPGAAARAGQDVGTFAAAEAQRWTEGLAGSGLAAADVAALHEVPVTIYTPGATHGVDLNVVGTLDVPADLSDPQATSEEIDAYVSSLLNLVGITADPLSSREHILLAAIINDAWSSGRALDLATLVASVQQPPIRKVGVLDLDAYYPAADRSALALRLNGLLASPAFAAWLGGQRIDIDAMLRTPDGRPRCAVVTTAHLNDEQRQSVTSVVLAKLIAWMRRQPGTSDLRTLLYLDEVAGYLPPVGNPPTKAPLLLLLKQARAFGVGVVLATQNPVDVDYKALSNAGTWLIGRLQTEQDKNRLLDGLTSASGAVDTAAVTATISSLGKREFVLKRASRDTVATLTSRWAMSYLRGPMTRDQIAGLRPAAPDPDPITEAGSGGPGSSAPSVTGPSAAGLATAAPGAAPVGDPAVGADETPVAPSVAAGIPVWFLDPAASWAAGVGAVPGRRLRPAVIARVQMEFEDRKAGIAHHEEHEAVLSPITAHPTPDQFVQVDYDDRDLLAAAPEAAIYGLPPSEVQTKTWWTSLQRSLTAHLVSSMSIQIPANDELKLYGRIGESAEAFATRCAAAATEGADKQISKLQAKYQTRINALSTRIDAAQDAVGRAEAQRTATMTSDAVGGLLGGLLGGRRSSMATIARRASTAQNRVAAANDRLQGIERTLSDLLVELDNEMTTIRVEWADRATATDVMDIVLSKSDVRVTSIGLVWIPVGA